MSTASQNDLNCTNYNHSDNKYKLYANKSVFSFQHQLTMWHRLHVLLYAVLQSGGMDAADCQPASHAAIDRYLLSARHTAANQPQRHTVGK